MSEAPTGGQTTGRPLTENLFYGAIAVIGLIGATAALIAATKPSDKGWVVVVGLVIAMVFGVTIAVGFYILLLTSFIVPQLKELVNRIKKDEAPGLIPALLATAQLIFIGATNEILNDNPALRWALSAILAALSLFGSLLAASDKDIGVTFIGAGMVIVSAGAVIFSAFTNHHWWANYLSLSVGDQIAIAGAIGISIMMLAATAIVVARRGRRTSSAVALPR